MLGAIVLQALAASEVSAPAPRPVPPAIVEAAAQGFAGEYLMAADGAILTNGAAGADAAGQPIRTGMVHGIGSIAKQFTGAAVLLLEAEGRLRTSDRLGDLLPDVPAGKADITLEMLAAHRSGIADLPEDDMAPIGREEAVRRLLAMPLTHQPNARFAYSNGGYTLLAVIVERQSGLPFQTFVRQRLLSPLDLSSTGWIGDPFLGFAPSPVGSVNGSVRPAAASLGAPGWVLMGNGGMVATLADLARWQAELRAPRVLPAAVAAKLCTPLQQSGALHGDTPERPVFEGFGCTSDAPRPGWRREGHNGASTVTGENAAMHRFRGPGADILVIAASPVLTVATRRGPAGDEFDPERSRIPALDFVRRAEAAIMDAHTGGR